MKIFPVKDGNCLKQDKRGAKAVDETSIWQGDQLVVAEINIPAKDMKAWELVEINV